MEFRYADGTIAAEDLVKHMALAGGLDEALREAIERKEVRAKAAELGIEASDDDLQAAADAFRKKRGLASAEMTMAFLRGQGLTVDDLEAFCEHDLLKAGVREALAAEKKQEEYFLTNRATFDRATISVLTVEGESLARELFMQIAEDEEDFAEIARKHSLDTGTKDAGGALGPVPRSAYSPEISSKIFSADPGDVLGPFPMGDQFLLILVESVDKAELDDRTRTVIKDRIFAEWTQRFLRSGIAIAE